MASRPPERARSSGILAVGQRGEFQAFAGFEQRQRDIERAIGGAAAGIVAVEAQDRLVVEPPHQRQLLCGERGAERRHGAFVSGHHHGDDVDIALDRDDAGAVVRRLAGGGDVVERRALVEERRLRRVEIFRRDFFLQRAAAEGDHPAAPIADRKHDAIAKPIIRHRNVFAADDQAGLDHVLDRDFGRAQMLLERVLLRRRIAKAEFELRRRGKAAVGEIAAAAGAATRRPASSRRTLRRARRCRAASCGALRALPLRATTPAPGRRPGRRAARPLPGSSRPR